MRRSTKMLLGISVALITAATLHLTAGNRYHRNFGQYRVGGCGKYRGDRHGGPEKPADLNPGFERRY